MAWTALNSTQTDADSPWDEDVADLIRTNFDHVFDGTQVGANLVTQTSMANSAIGRAELKTSTEEQYVTLTMTAGTVAIVTFSSAGQYGFYPRTKADGTSANAKSGLMYGGSYSTSYTNGAYFECTANGTSRNMYADVAYIQASPPHTLLSDEDHGAWVYALILKATGLVLRKWCAGDPPYWLAGFSRYGKLGKMHPERFGWKPHPFADLGDALVPGGIRVGDMVGAAPLATGRLVRADDCEIVTYYLPHLNEVAESRPKAKRLKAFLDEPRSKLINAQPAELEAFEAKLREAAEIEAERASAAKVMLDDADERLADRIRKHRRKKTIRKGAVLPRYSRSQLEYLEKWEAARMDSERAELRKAAGLARKVDMIPSGEMLDAIDTSVCTRCISSDKSHPDRKRLPSIYTDSPGSPFLVRVMTTP